jgi:predicted AAA+ superfamily ATPase
MNNNQIMLKRQIATGLEKEFFTGKIVMLLGPRQVGKTTLVRSLLSGQAENTSIYFDGESRDAQAALQPISLAHLEQVIGSYRVVAIDEAQKIAGIGSTLKLLADNFGSSRTFIVTGSSSLNLLNETSEPLTGRKRVFYLYPFSCAELMGDADFQARRQIFTHQLIYGSYPEVYSAASYREKRRQIEEIADSYLYRDLLAFNMIRKSNKITDLLKLLSYQIGSEVSYQEIGNRLNLSRETVENYIDMLEKSFVIFRLPPYRFNARRAITGKRKVYFYDLGIRNALINNFQSLEIRPDRGAMFENFCVAERLKKRSYQQIYGDQYFYRSYDGAEVDLIEDRDGMLYGYEFKFGERGRAREPIGWSGERQSEFAVINTANFYDWLLQITE